MEITSGAHWLDGKGSNFYLCDDREEGLTLIDAGMPKREQLVWDKINKLGRQPSDLKRIILTHSDFDHAGSLAVIQAATGAKVYASALAAECLSKGNSPPRLPRMIQSIANRFIRYTPIPADVIEVIEDGDVLPGLGEIQILATPGHTPDHLSFFAPVAGILFAGDALFIINGRLQRTPKIITVNEEEANNSAIRLLELSPAIIACGHGKPMSDHSSQDLMMLFNRIRASYQN